MFSPLRIQIVGFALSIALGLAAPALAQRRGGARFGRGAPRLNRGYTPAQPKSNSAARPPLGTGLERLYQLPPGQREQALRNDPSFKNLSPARQTQLLNGLHRFNAMPPAQQQRVIRRLGDLGRLTPPQRAGLMDVFRQFQAMPPAQRRSFRTAYNNLRQLPPDQRELRMSQPAFQQRFTQQQLQTLHQALQLDLPPDVVGARPPGGF